MPQLFAILRGLGTGIVCRSLRMLSILASAVGGLFGLIRHSSDWLRSVITSGYIDFEYPVYCSAFPAQRPIILLAAPCSGLPALGCNDFAPCSLLPALGG